MNIIITGASSGIGYELVKKLYAGDNKILVIARNEKSIKKLSDECKNVIPLPFDLQKIHGLEEVITNAINEHLDGRADSLINNAGKLINKPFELITREDLENVFDTNLFAPAHLIKVCLPFLRSSASPAILNISSMGGIQGSAKFPGLSVYSASKGALSILTECLAEEFKDEGIKVNCLALGAVETEMFKSAFPNFTAPLQAHEIADFIAGFVRSGYKYFNGKTLPVSVSTP